MREVYVSYAMVHGQRPDGWWVQLTTSSGKQEFGPYPDEDAAVGVKVRIMTTLEGGPFETEPYPLIGPQKRLAVLADALDGVELGAYDQRLLRWLADMGDPSTVLTIAGWIRRARQHEQDLAEQDEEEG